MISVWLVRHGEAAASWGEHPDPGLSDLGRQQAQATARTLFESVPQPCSVLSSPKQRARETAEPFAGLVRSAIEIEPAFQEVRAPVPLAERQPWLKQFMAQGWIEQDETLWQWRRDIIDRLARISQPTVIFSHFLVINAVIAEVRRSDAVLQAWPANGSLHRVDIAEGKLTAIELGEQMSTPVT